MPNFRNDGAQPEQELVGLMQYRGHQQVKKNRAKPQVDDDEKVVLFAPVRVAAGAERQVDEKRQRGEQDNNQVHRLLFPGDYPRRRDRSHIDQAAHRGTRGNDMRGDIATEQDGTDRHAVGTGFNQVHGNMRRIEIRHNQ